MAVLTHRPWLSPALLMILSIIPIAAAIAGMVAMSWTPSAEAMARAAHLVPVGAFCLLGIWQLTPAARRRFPRVHWLTGRIYVAVAVILAVSGAYMNAVFHSQTSVLGRDAGASYVFCALLLICLVQGVAAARRRHIARHRGWMIRSFAIGVAPTTHALLFIPIFILHGDVGQTSTSIGMWAGWIINLIAAEWIIRRPTLNKIGAN